MLKVLSISQSYTGGIPLWSRDVWN